MQPAPNAPDADRTDRDRRSARRALLLFAVTLVSVFWAGYYQVLTYRASTLGSLEQALASAHPLQGWIFAIPLLGILIFHEAGHYVLARIHGVDTSPPYFIPFPSIIGTMGAVISIRSPIYNRKALMDIGAAGPIAGFVPTLLVLYVGYRLSDIVVMDTLVNDLGGPAQFIVFGDSLVTRAMQLLTAGPLPEGHDIMLHPVGFAGWVGMLVTFLNLLPVGQFDGGHIFYALWGRLQWKVGPAAIAAILLLGILVSWWWLQLLLFFLILIHAVVLIGRLFFKARIPLAPIWKGRILAHPPVPNEEPLDRRRAVIGWICVVIFLLCLMPDPIRFVTLG